MVKRTWMEETYTNGTPLFYCSITPSKLGWSGMLKVKTNQPACNKYINKDNYAAD